MAATRHPPWTRVAEAVGQVIPTDRLHEAVRTCVATGPASRGRWVVAVSGGSDSVALVLLLWAHWPERRERLVLAHFDHGLRGSASAADARFCRGLARGLGVVIECGRWERGGSEEKVSESEARSARNGFLERVRKQQRAQVIWTGHQRDDVAETMLMRMARGSGAGGLSAPRPVQSWGSAGVRLRPLLEISRAELVDALQNAGARWCEDETNAGEDYFRNRLRNRVVPAWIDAAGRDAMAGAALSRQLLAEDHDALEAWLDSLEPISADGSLVFTALAGRPIALWRRALHRWLALQEDVGDLSRQGFTQLLERVRRGQTSRFSLGKCGFGRIRKGRLYFEKLSD